MGKLDKIVTLMSLLQSRRSVDLGTITRLCEISERTAYRYIARLSAANVPVFYENETGGYALASRAGKSVGDLSAGEICMVLTALELLRNRLHEGYDADIVVLMTKIMASTDSPAEEYLKAFEESGAMLQRDFSDTMTDLLIRTAVKHKRRLCITTTEDTCSPRVLREPQLRFKNGWRVDSTESSNSESGGIPLDKVTKVNML
jgi:predicted DNA-binding transcriptional regulator YafY